MATRISSQDIGYQVGQLSLYPEILDSRNQLYEATNNSVTTLKQSVTYGGKYVIVNDNSSFPQSGILRIGPPPGQDGSAEMVYYGSKAKGVFKDIIRGFAGSRQNQWPVGSFVSNSVFAEHHNSVKDALINIETNLGIKVSPTDASLNGILKKQETKFLAPKALFRASIIKGPPPFKVRFHNFSTGPIVRSLWDFGDGTTSIERSPTHIYRKEGKYSVQLNVITSLGAQGFATKSNYITVDKELKPVFFYTTPNFGISKETAEADPINYPDGPTVFNFIDQTDGDITKRWWILDGPAREYGETKLAENQTVLKSDPNIHTLKIIYEKKGEYNPSLLVLLSSQTLKKAFVNPSNTPGSGILVQ
jgi:hypothetical protein